MARRKNTAEAFEVLLRKAKERKKASSGDAGPGGGEEPASKGNSPAQTDPVEKHGGGPTGAEDAGPPKPQALRLRRAPLEPLLAPPRPTRRKRIGGYGAGIGSQQGRGSKTGGDGRESAGQRGAESAAGPEEGPVTPPALRRWLSERPARARRSRPPAAESPERPALPERRAWSEPPAYRCEEARQDQDEARQDADARRALLSPLGEEDMGDVSEWEIEDTEAAMLQKTGVDPVLLERKGASGEQAGAGSRESGGGIHCLEARNPSSQRSRVSAPEETVPQRGGLPETPTPRRDSGGGSTRTRSSRSRRRKRGGAQPPGERRGGGKEEGDAATKPKAVRGGQADSKGQAGTTPPDAPEKAPAAGPEMPPSVERAPEPFERPAAQEAPRDAEPDPGREPTGPYRWARLLDRARHWTLGTTLAGFLERRVEVRVSTFVVWGMVGVVVAVLLFAQGIGSGPGETSWNPPPGQPLNPGAASSGGAPGEGQNPGPTVPAIERPPLVHWSPRSGPRALPKRGPGRSAVEDPDLRGVTVTPDPGEAGGGAPAGKESLESSGEVAEDEGSVGSAEPDVATAPYVYRIQVRARESREGARAIIDYMQEIGFTDHHIEEDLGAPGLYRVFVGKFFERGAANRACDRLKQQALRRPFKRRGRYFQDSIVIQRARD